MACAPSVNGTASGVPTVDLLEIQTRDLTLIRVLFLER